MNVNSRAYHVKTVPRAEVSSDSDDFTGCNEDNILQPSSLIWLQKTTSTSPADDFELDEMDMNRVETRSRFVAEFPSLDRALRRMGKGASSSITVVDTCLLYTSPSPRD